MLRKFAYVTLVLFFGLCVDSVFANKNTGIKDVALVTNVQQLEAGDTFNIAVQFEIADGWHLYWKNPGEYGVAPEIDFQEPKGFSVGDLRWPTPERFEQRKDIAGFGYSKQILLSAPVTSSPDAEGRNALFKAEVRWLACNLDRCVPGSAAVKTSVEVRDITVTKNEKLFQQHQDRLPLSLENADKLVSVSTDGSLVKFGGKGVFEIKYNWKTPVKPIDWFSADFSGLSVERVDFSTADKTTTLRFRAMLSPSVPLDRSSLESVLAFQDSEGGLKGIQVLVPLDNK